jgi:hypothetical protein
VKAAAVAALLGTLWGPIATGATAASLTTDVGGVHVELSSTPETPVKDPRTAYTVRLVDSAGKPLTDARVTLTGRMADGMSTAAPLRPAGEPGVYRGEVLFTMEGRWDLTVRVVRQAGRLEIPVREQVGR